MNSGTFKKGEKRPNQGKRGPNKTTVRVREAITTLLESNIDNMQKWLIQTAEKDPAKALQLVSNMLEYHIPKMSRVQFVESVESDEETEKRTKYFFDILQQMEAQRQQEAA